MVKSKRFWLPFAGAMGVFVGAIVALNVFGGLTITLGSSLPTVLVRYEPGAPVGRGQIASVCFPEDVIDFARRYHVQWFGTGCPTGAGHVFKIVAAVAGDTVTIWRDGVYVNTVRFPMSAPLYADRVWPSVHLGVPFTVPRGSVVLMGLNVRSLDSRYVGLFPVSSIVGRIDPVWPAAGIVVSSNMKG
jgi:conjugative transfer signal peptidase TraF